jgi:hypothetical protein
MNKKIRYAIGAVGAVPALAMIPGQFAAPAAHAGKTATATGKTVRTVYARDTAAFATTSSTSPAISPNVGSCTGTIGNHTTHSDITVRFYDRRAGTDRTCIGTIKVSATGFNSSVGGRVANSHNTHFCSFFFPGKTVASHRCRRVFDNTSGFDAPSPLAVVGSGGNFFGASPRVFSVIHSGHFRSNHFGG